jgi:hypothetical protein
VLETGVNGIILKSIFKKGAECGSKKEKLYEVKTLPPLEDIM